MMWADILVAMLAGPLLTAGVAKWASPAGRLSWPIHRGPFAPPQGPRVVATAEIAAAVLLVCVPGRASAVLALGVFGVLTAVARALHGRSCACFGVVRLAEVGRGHTAGNALAAIAAAAAAVGGPGDRVVLRGAVAITAAVLTTAAVLLASRRAEKKAEAEAARVSERTEPVYRVRLYTAESCPSCVALKTLLATMDRSRRAAVSETVLGDGESAPGALAGLGVPCAQGENLAGEPVGHPVVGIGPVKALVNSVTVGPAPAVTRGR